MVNPDEAEEKFEKLATSMKGTSGDDDDDKMDESVKQALKALKESDMPSNPDFKGVGALKDKSKIQKRDTISLVAQDKSKHMTGLSKDDTKNVADFIKKDVPYQDSKGGHTLELKKDGNVRNLTKIARGEKIQMNSYDPLSNKEILGISEKILKKNFDLGEEGYDIARDEGKVKPSKDKKDATTMPPSEEMKKTQKKSKGKSALELVKAKYKDSIMDTEKKKEEK